MPSWIQLDYSNLVMFMKYFVFDNVSLASVNVSLPSAGDWQQAQETPTTLGNSKFLLETKNTLFWLEICQNHMNHHTFALLLNIQTLTQDEDVHGVWNISHFIKFAALIWCSLPLSTRQTVHSTWAKQGPVWGS